MIPARRLALSTVLAGLVLAGVTGCGSSRADHDAAKAGAPAAMASSGVSATPGAMRSLKDTPFERTWDLQLKQPIDGSWILPEVPDLVFFQLSKTHEIVAVDAMSGNTRWVSQALPEALKHAPGASHVRLGGGRGDAAAVIDDRLYAVSQDILFCIDIASGQFVWRYELPFSPSSSPLAVGVDGNLRVFLGDWAGRMQVVSYETAKGFPLVAWQFPLGSTVTATPIEREDIAYFGDGAGVLHAFKMDREQIWTYSAGGRIDGGVAVRDRVLFAGTTDNILFAVNRLTGEKLGQVNLNAPITRAPFVFRGDRDRVFAWVSLDHGERGGIYAFHAVSDTVAYSDDKRHPLEVVRMAIDWHLPGVDRLVASTPGQLYATSGDSTVIQAIDRTTGTVGWTWDVAQERAAEQTVQSIKGADQAKITHLITYADPTDTNRTIYALDSGGGVVAYRFFGYVPEQPAAAESVAMPTKKADKAAKPAAEAPAPAAP